MLSRGRARGGLLSFAHSARLASGTGPSSRGRLRNLSRAQKSVRQNPWRARTQRIRPGDRRRDRLPRLFARYVLRQSVSDASVLTKSFAWQNTSRFFTETIVQALAA